MKKEEFKLLVCPECKGKLQYLENENILLCSECGRKYPIIEDIPILLPEEEIKDALYNMGPNSHNK